MRHFLSFLAAGIVAAAAGRPAFPELLFEENLGQSSAGVRFLARAQGHTVFLGGDEAAFAPVEGAAVRLRFPGARGGRWEAVGEARDQISYYVGNDASKWVRGARQYARVAWREAYPGIDIVFYGDGRRLEYDFVVAAGADAGQVRLRFHGAEARLESDGSIVAGSVMQRAPKIYQPGGKTIAGRFVSNGNGEFRLELGDYDRSAALVIDPVVETYHTMGGENDDEIKVVTDIFVAGNTRSVRFVDQQWARRRTRDVFVRGIFGPLSQIGNRENFFGTLVFGGSDDDELGGVAGSTFGGIVARVAGTTKSTDLPMAVNRYQGGVSDGFAFSMTAGGTFSGPQLVDSVYVGGSGEDRIHALAGNLTTFVFAGVTDSSDLKTTGALMSAPGGGKDVFVGLLSGFTQRDWSVGYLGGEGDDVGYTAALLPPFQIVVGGETASGNFPFLASGAKALTGASDGFLTFLSTAVTFDTGPTIIAASLPITSYLVGGDGTDSVRAITSPTRRSDLLDNLLSSAPVNPSVFGVAGVTTSKDLATPGAAQGALGGESDAFGGIWDLTRREPIWISYAGGSGADGAYGAAMNWYGDLAIGGSTMSRDLPVLDAVQKDPGGGEDGFFALFTRTGVARQVTYFGGAGDDRITAVSSYGGKTMRVGGVTASSGFRPGVRNYEEGGSGVEGFVASIGTHYLSGPDGLNLPKDGAVTIHFRSHTSELGLPITYRSADVSKVRIFRLGAARAEATIPAEEGVQIEALADAGEVLVTASAPGHADKEIRVRLYPGVFEFSTVAPTLRVLAPGTTLNLLVAYSAFDEALGRTVGTAFLRQGRQLPVVRWRSSEPSVLTINTLPTFGPMFATIAGVGAGEAQLSAEIEGFRVLEGPVFRVQPYRLRLSGGSMALGKDLMSGLSLREVPARTVQLTARTSDPSKLLVSEGFAGIAGESATIAYRGSVFTQFFAVHALADAGEVTVTVSSPELEADAVFVVKLEPSMVRCGDFNFPPPVRTEVRTLPLRPISFGCQIQGVRDAPASDPRPGVDPLVLELDNSDPAVVELGSVFLESNRRTDLTGIKAGTATIGVRRVSGPFALERDRVPVTVDGLTIDIRGANPVEIGKDLQWSVSITGLATLEELEIVAESSDPSAVLVSASFETAGSARTVIRRSSGTQYTLFLQALKGSGNATVTIRYPGAPVQTIAVTLLPSTISVDVAPGSAGIAEGFETRLAVAPYAVDDVTGQRVARQSLRPGLSTDVRLRVEGAAVRLSTESMRLGREGGSELFVTYPPVGEEAEIVATATGFEELAIASRYRLRRPGDPLPERSRPITLAEHTVTSHNTTSLNSARRTFKSGDPAKLLISPTFAANAYLKKNRGATLS